MQLNKILKSLAIALPLFTLAACSSSDTDSTEAAETNQPQVENSGRDC